MAKHEGLQLLSCMYMSMPHASLQVMFVSSALKVSLTSQSCSEGNMQPVVSLQFSKVRYASWDHLGGHDHSLRTGR